MAPFFFFSYVHDDNDEFLEKFFNDLRDEVAAVTTLDKADVAFRDLSGIGLMQPWRQEIVNALSTCECFVPLLTPRLIVHPYCGQEWEIFRRRLQVNPLPASGAPSRLMPILWRPLRGPLPPVISDHQRTHGTFGRPYAEDGLFMLLKQKEYDSEYARFLKRFVEMMIEAVQAAPLPASASPGDLESMPNAFQSANGRPAAAAQETSAADHVWLIIAAGAETELRGFRKDVAAYGTTGKQWRPFQRPCLEPALVAAQSVVAGEGLLSSPRLFDDEIIRQLTDSRDEIFVIMLDPWSVDLPPYRKALEWFDRQRFAGGSLLMIWAADVETR